MPETKQTAFVFAKPHANTPAFLAKIKEKFDEKGISIVSEGEIDGKTIDAKGYIDQHYYAIASKATIMKPKELNIPTDKFKEFAGEEWSTVLEENRAFNAMDVQAELKINAEELDTLWAGVKKAKKLVKFGGGFYCGLVSEPTESKPEAKKIYTFNAFFMSMRGKFTDPKGSVHYYVVTFDPAKLAWADFRGKVLGPTDPATAPADLLRGIVNSDWKELGLTAAPDTGDNGVHASASPFEGLAERVNWLGQDMEKDEFASKLLAAGIPKAMLEAWSVDPQVTLPGGDGKKGSLFDQLEDMDIDDCIAKCKEIHAAQ